MRIASPTVGPIVGYTTASEARIWIRGEFEARDGAHRRCFGAVRFRERGRKTWSEPQFNKLAAHFDMSGVFVIQGLRPDTGYEYQAGWFFAEADLDSVQQMGANLFQWPELAHRFTSGTADRNASRSYVVGSCRYLLRLFNGTVFDERGDKGFRTIADQMDKGMQTDALLMVGDQIYADDLNVVSPDVRIDQFLARYRTVFSQEGIRRLMAQVPTYMILDDHEIEDNWPTKATKQDRLTLYPHAVHAYQIYQCSHSPIFEATADGRLDGTLTHFWYRFSDGCADWFVLDSRTERSIEPDGRKMIRDTQMRALLEWLSDGSGRIKFVVSSVPFIPDLNNDKDDKWGAFSEQRDQIISHIHDNRIRKVVFVSGDVHCSFTCQLACPDDPEFLVHQVVSSSFFWPYPHMQENDFAFSGSISTVNGRRYAVRRTSPVHSTDNFARIEASPDELRVSFYERKGERLGKPVRLALA